VAMPEPSGLTGGLRDWGSPTTTKITVPASRQFLILVISARRRK
jgi:hypothetical protein